MAAGKVFYMVWVLDRPSPTRTHETYASAQAEAARLAAVTNRQTFVLKAIESHDAKLVVPMPRIEVVRTPLQ